MLCFLPVLRMGFVYAMPLSSSFGIVVCASAKKCIDSAWHIPSQISFITNIVQFPYYYFSSLDHDCTCAGRQATALIDPAREGPASIFPLAEIWPAALRSIACGAQHIRPLDRILIFLEHRIWPSYPEAQSIEDRTITLPC